MNSIFSFLVPIIVGISLYFYPAPGGMDTQGWHLFAIFVATITGLIFKPLPMGAVALIGMAATVLTGTLKLQPEALSGYGDSIIWLVLYVFFIARGFIKTKLGIRIAYKFVQWFGRSALGMGYSIVATELFIAPFIPSSAARAGGIMFPVVTAISESLDSHPHDSTRRKIGAYLHKIAYNGNLITSAMFLTAMAANPMCQSFAATQGVQITWSNWAVAAAVPGLLSLLLIPLFLYFVFPPSQKRFDHAPAMAQKKLSDMGQMSGQEWLMAGVFLLMLGLWIFGEPYGISAATTALLGLCLLLVTKILSWDDILNEKEAWHTLIWFAILVTMAKYLQIYGVVAWFSTMVSTLVEGRDWMSAFGILVLIYFYSHYFFASNTSHVSAMYAAFLAVAIAAGTPPLVAALGLGFCSSLFSSMTHYGASSSAMFFGAGYIDIGTWWRLGFLISVVNLLVWFGAGGVWWKILGLW
ncbi:DASS family sodium-coupled anion symporter [Candidatus Odyssella thessalonicensis]|uniref:DASS family sodium-coupled anion symporter n=1 Tax=Candidatus Odyssella thessalonicensis TaxID=84647 RepID=UPI000225B92D|nr:DASS family sodium-coupled anion symporter [Candidatus Odyssella thessalonicensis]